MMPNFAIYPIALSSGTIAISPIPGRSGQFEADINTILRWNPDLVLTMTTCEELRQAGAIELPDRLQDAGTGWLHLPISDFGVPDAKTAALWPTAAAQAHTILNRGGKVLIHCYGGKGRSGMAALRLMVERGVRPDLALANLRDVRLGAVETNAQLAWASDTATGAAGSISPRYSVGKLT
jgi:predicted protein tyrosine phosphatase